MLLMLLLGLCRTTGRALRRDLDKNVYYDLHLRSYIVPCEFLRNFAGLLYALFSSCSRFSLNFAHLEHILSHKYTLQNAKEDA